MTEDEKTAFEQEHNVRLSGEGWQSVTIEEMQEVFTRTSDPNWKPPTLEESMAQILEQWRKGK